MKLLLLSACLPLLAVLPALCSPIEDDAFNYDQQGGGLATEMESLYNGVGNGVDMQMPETLKQQFSYNAEMPEYTQQQQFSYYAEMPENTQQQQFSYYAEMPENTQQQQFSYYAEMPQQQQFSYNAEMPETLPQQYYAESEDNEPEVPISVVEEIRKQYEEGQQMAQQSYIVEDQGTQEPTLPSDAADEIKNEIKGGDMVLVESKSSGRVLRQGCRVGFQLLFNYLWLGCAGRYCGGASCPLRHFEGADVKRCWGEVFQLFRVRGKGNLVSGDFVGIYYPREKRWFSMSGGRGHKNPCPGYPTSTYGFRSLHHWFYCGGEVFQVFAQGKSNGAIITDQDNLAFYYPAGRRFVSFQPRYTVLSGCIKSRFPSSIHFDRCLWDSVEITIID